MKTLNYLACSMALVSSLAAISLEAHANDRKVMLPISAAMEAKDAQERLDSSVKFYFSTQKAPAVATKLGADKTSAKTNAFGKSDEKACNWAFLSSMLHLQKRAKELGADAVVNIVSNYNNVEFSSETEFECHAGAIMAGVALKGEFVRLEKK